MAEFWSQETDSVMSREGKGSPESSYNYCVSKTEKPDTSVCVKEDVR